MLSQLALVAHCYRANLTYATQDTDTNYTPYQITVGLTEPLGCADSESINQTHLRTIKRGAHVCVCVCVSGT